MKQLVANLIAALRANYGHMEEPSYETVEHYIDEVGLDFAEKDVRAEYLYDYLLSMGIGEVQL